MTIAAAPAASWLSVHLWHLVGGAVFLVVSLGVAAFADRRQPAPARVRTRPGRTPRRSPAAAEITVAAPPVTLIICLVASVAAASVHFTVMPEHFEESALYGAFFAVVATVQLAWTCAVARFPDRRLLLAGAAGNGAVVLLWLATRLIAIPLGPAAGTTEAFSGLDTVCSCLELLVVLAAIPLLRRPQPPARHRLPVLLRSPLLLSGLVVAAGVVTVTALVSPPS